MPSNDLESQLADPATRKFNLLRRFTGKSLKDTEQDSHQNEEIKICQNLISLLVDNQETTPSLVAACKWYINYLKFNTGKYWPLIRSSLSAVESSSKSPSQYHFAVVISFVHEVARKLITEKDVALCDIVDPLTNDGYFKPDLEYSSTPTQLVFTVIGWLLLLYEVPLEQRYHKLQIKASLTASAYPTSFLNSEIFEEYSQGFEYIDKPFYQLLGQFGDIMLEVKPEASKRPSFTPASENIYVQMVCYSTAQHITRLEIEWGDCLTQHLELDVARRTLKLFRYPSYCRMMCHKQNIHRQILTDHEASLLESDREPVVPADSFFRELLLTFRVLFGQDERSFRAFRRSCSRQDAHHASDPLLPVLCGGGWTMPDASDLYRDINAGAVCDTYDSNGDFPIMGQKLLALQQFVKDYHPRTLTALLRDRRDPLAWCNFRTNWALLLFASLAILTAVLQLIFQIWQVVLAQRQLFSSPIADTSKCRQIPLVDIIVLSTLYNRLLEAWKGYRSDVVAVLVIVASTPFIIWLECSLTMFMRPFLEEGMLRFQWTCVCGHTSFDDFKETDADELQLLAQQLLESGSIKQASISTSVEGTMSFAMTTILNTVSAFKASVKCAKSFAMASILNTVLAFKAAWKSVALSRLKILSQSPVLYTAATQRRHQTPLSIGTAAQGQLQGSARTILSAQEQQKTPTKTTATVQRQQQTQINPLYLLLCVNQARFDTRLLHMDIQGTKSDQELFNAIKIAYGKTRGRIRNLLSKPRAAHFVQFEVRPKTLVDIYEQRPLLPPYPHPDYIYKYTARKPPIGSNWLIHILHHPEDAADATICIQHFPKKLLAPPSFQASADCTGCTGWGIWFEEGPHIAFIGTLIFCFALLSAGLCGLLWSILGYNIQDAWAISSWITSVGSLGAAIWAAWLMGQ